MRYLLISLSRNDGIPDKHRNLSNSFLSIDPESLVSQSLNIFSKCVWSVSICLQRSLNPISAISFSPSAKRVTSKVTYFLISMDSPLSSRWSALKLRRKAEFNTSLEMADAPLANYWKSITWLNDSPWSLMPCTMRANSWGVTDREFLSLISDKNSSRVILKRVRYLLMARTKEPIWVDSLGSICNYNNHHVFNSFVFSLICIYSSVVLDLWFLWWSKMLACGLKNPSVLMISTVYKSNWICDDVCYNKHEV